MAVQVYGTPVAVAVSRVLACLLEKHVAFDVIFKGEQKLPGHLKIQPFGQVPAFKDENISLFESRAICRYVCEKYSNKGNRGLYGLNQLEKASIDQRLEAEGQSFHPPSTSLIYQLAIAPRMNVDPDEELNKQNEKNCPKSSTCMTNADSWPETSFRWPISPTFPTRTTLSTCRRKSFSHRGRTSSGGGVRFPAENPGRRLLKSKRSNPHLDAFVIHHNIEAY